VPAASGALPTGSVTFLLTDVEGSTRRWEQSPGAMRQAMAAHDRLVAGCVASHRGHQVESGREGDSVLAAFRRPEAALACAIELQRRLRREPWPPGAEIRVRMALNTGHAELRGGHYYGQAVYRCARLLATGHGGQVLAAQATCDRLPARLPAGVSLRDLGIHQLKDLDRPEHVHQVDHPDLAAEFPPLRSLDAFRHNLPAAASSFVDRPAEVAEIIEALGRSRLVTLTGPAGAGKTRLALHVAAQLVERYDAGAWLLELAPLTDPDLVLPGLLGALGVREELERSPAEVLTSFLREKRMLVVLDNCEHLATAAAALASAVLAAGLGPRILATSRLPLRAAGEARWPVPAMAAAEEAAALFAERALAADPNFRPADHRAEVLEICRRLDGNPLAIELAAARVGLMSPAEILDRLEHRFRLLTTGPRTAAARHRTLRAAIDWSHELLDARERTLFRRLSVFAGGFTLEAAETVASGGEIDPGEVLDLLGQLVDHSLVFAQPADTASTRYRLLETLREYARDRLAAAGEEARTRRRHAAYYVAMAEIAEAMLHKPSRLEWLRRLDLEQDNLRAVFDSALPSGQGLELRLAAALDGYWDSRGHYAEGRARLAAALDRDREPTPIRAAALRGAATQAWVAGDFDASDRLCRESLDICRRLGDRPGTGASLQQLGQIAIQREDLGGARACLEEALAIAGEVGDGDLAALCRLRLGLVALFASRPADARRLLESSLFHGRESGNSEMVVVSLFTLAHLAVQEARLDEARSHLAEGLAAWREQGSPRQVATLLDGFAEVAAAEGLTRRAARLAAAAESLRRQIGDAPASPLQRRVSERLRAARVPALDEVPLGREQAIAYALGEAGEPEPAETVRRR